MQFVRIQLDPGEAVVAEAGSMMYLEDGIQMDTVFGDGSQQNQGFMGALLGAGKRLLTGESLFMTVFHNESREKRWAAFAAPYPGKIQAMHLSQLGGEIIAQKDSFLAAAKGVSIGIAFQRRFGAGLFGGEGFIMQRLEGDGWAFVNAGGTLEERTLAPGETLRVDTGCLVALQPTVQYDIQFVGKRSPRSSAGRASSSRPFADRAASGSSRSPSAGSRVGSTPRRPRRADGGRRRIDPRGSREPDRRRRAYPSAETARGRPVGRPWPARARPRVGRGTAPPETAGDPGSLAAGALPVVDYVAMPSHVPTIDSLPRPTPCTKRSWRPG